MNAGKVAGIVLAVGGLLALIPGTAGALPIIPIALLVAGLLLAFG